MDDFRQAFRSLRKHPGFTGVAVLTLAFGIGVNSSLFSMVSAFFLQPLPVKDAHRLVLLLQRSDVLNFGYGGHSFPDYRDYRASARSFSELAAYLPTPAHLSAAGQTPERTWIEVVSSNYFTLAGASPAYGAFPRPGEGEDSGGPATVVLSYRYWQRRFGGNPALVGQPITINGRTFTVTGIAPETFTGLSWAMAVSAFVPAGAAGALLENGDALRDDRGAATWRLMGRLAPGTTFDQARAEVEVIAKRLAAAYPAEHENSRVVLIPENRARPDPSVSSLLPVFAVVFAAMVALVLLIACANVANLMFSRALGRQRDLVIRSALGASRRRLVRLQLAESVLLAAAAGLLGILLAHWSGQALAGLVPAGDIPVNEHDAWDWRTYAFTLLISLIAGVVTGVWPARRATSFNLVESLKEGGHVAGRSRNTLRNLLVVGQVTMSLVVLVSAGLFLQSLRQMQNLALGFRPDGLLTMSIDLGLQQYSDQRGRRFLDELLSRAKARPGVTSATLATHVPFDYGMQFTSVGIDGPIPGTKDDELSAAFNAVGPAFFETTGAALTRGRAFDARDDEHAHAVTIVNETMARTLWPDQEPIGQRFRLGRTGDWVEVIGVARDGKYVTLGEAPRSYFYLPVAQHYRTPITVIVRAAGDPAALAMPMQRMLNGLDPHLPVFDVRTMRDHVRDSVFGLMPLRLGASMAGVQGAIGLLLAVMGLYAVVSYTVARRTREIGLRMALGAERVDVLRFVMREGMRLTAIGAVLGVLISLGLGVVLSRVLYGVRALDLGVLAAVTVLLCAISAMACYLPARRATRVDPLTALRCE